MIIESIFNYKYITRYILINKLKIYNTYDIPKFKELKFYFNLNRLEDMNEVQLYNYFYLIKFFFGRNSFFSKTNKFYLLGTWYNNFNVQLIIKNNDIIIKMIYYLYNNILINIEKNLLYKNIKGLHLNIFCIIIKDLNIYSELKTNLGLFNIKRNFNINLYFIGSNIKYNSIFLKNMKFI